ncbi:MAG: hypothetical protein J7604_07785 [Sporocytophaga sp.]|uniref:hypothetical protein n=1 Tax=Sporocytophaga sp. TaxID=2231183 RepID=UPI001B141E28|nr:hypothetical protein [Sporocytophaga sp.]MBO9700097.1 hypothetical protein [Sporocytophaga sp.]
MIRLLLITLGILLYTQTQAQVTIKGKYEGTNLYFTNPYSNDSFDTFCTDSVFVNEKTTLDYIHMSAFEVDLSHLAMHDTFQVKVFHKKSCKPRLLNRNTCPHIKSFWFKSLEIKRDSLFWTCSIIPKGKFQIERFDYNRWVNHKEVKASDAAKYSSLVKHYSGLNKYRIKFLQENGEVIYSSVVEVFSETPNLKVQTINKELLFSHEIDFEILNAYGNRLLKGSSSTVDLSFLSDGIYYLNADNNTYRIKIKEENIKIKGS